MLLVAQKQQVQWQMQLGLTIMSAAAALFSKDGSQSTLDSMQEIVEGIDMTLRGEPSDDDEYEDDEPAKPRRRKKKSARTRENGQNMVRRFHGQFSALMMKQGVAIPPIGQAVKHRGSVITQQNAAVDSQTKKS